MCECQVLRGWFNYFNELVEEIDCVECIKVNIKKSTEKMKVFDSSCAKCFQHKTITMQDWRNDIKKEYEKEFFQKWCK